MKEVAIKKNILLLWIEWYYVDVPKGITRAWINFLLFNLHFFSISFLIKTLFSHWHKTMWYRERGFNLSRFFEIILSNTFSRAIGAMMRFFLISIGIIFEIFIFFIGIIVLLSWITMPFFIILFFIIGINYFF